MSRFRTVGARLSAALLVVVAVALGIVYLIVVPSLEDRLVNAKLSQLERAAPGVFRQYLDHANDQDFLQNLDRSTNARVVVFQRLTPYRPTLAVFADSQPGARSDLTADSVALRASTSLQSSHGTVTRNGERFAEAAVPAVQRTSGGVAVLLLSTSLKGSLADVGQVQRAFVVGGLVALLVALLVGYGGAWLFARRIRRLERAAERIAGGKFDQPVADKSSDELGELARAFERMRVRLARLDDARREFVANASHELRTPLFSLGGFLELMVDEEVDEPTRREFLETMAEQVERLTKLASELLDLSRLDAGKLHVERESIDLAALAHSLVEEFAAVAKASEHPLTADGGEGVAAAADEQRVRQIGRVLVENALLHTPSGTPVRVRAAAEKGRATLVVEDEGGGIPSEQHEQLFQRFYRLDGARASGSGLGLAIARELAERMEGTIEVQSRAGLTAFKLVLPQQPAEPAPISRENGAAAGRERTPATP